MRFFRLINTQKIFFFHSRLLASAGKVITLLDSGGCSPPVPLARTIMDDDNDDDDDDV